MIIKQKDYWHCQRIKPILHDIYGRPFIKKTLKDLSGISRGGGGGGNRGSVTTFGDSEKEGGMKNGPVKRGRVMQIYARDHVEVHPQMEVLYLVKKKKKNNGTL